MQDKRFSKKAPPGTPRPKADVSDIDTTHALVGSGELLRRLDAAAALDPQKKKNPGRKPG